MLKIRFKMQQGYMSSNLPTTVLWTVLLIISIILAGIFAIALFNGIKEHRVKSNLDQHSRTITQQINKNFKHINEIVENAINFDLSQYDNTNSDQLIDKIKNEIPDALRVMISTRQLKDINPGEFPDINYATLDMLKNTHLKNKNPIAEIHLFGQQDQYINYVHILNNEKQHYLILSLPAQKILKNIENPSLEEGNIRITQNAGKFSLVQLKSWGKIVKSSNIFTQSSNIENSYFVVEYNYKPAKYKLRGMSSLSLTVGLLSSILLFTAVILNILKMVKQIKLQKKNTKPVYVPVNAAAKEKASDNTGNNIENSDMQRLGNNQTTQEFEISKSIFRAYDIRGTVDDKLTPEAVRLIGQAIATENKNRGKTEIVIARDGRLSGPSLLEALTEGLNKGGCNVINIGAVPTGVLYFATHHLEIGSGVMLTGSHNPPNYNGLKIMLNGETLAGDLILNLYKAILHNELNEGEGTIQEMDIVDDYIDYISSDIQLENELKIVVDSGNGIGGVVGPQVLEEIGCEVIPLHCEIDGSFPNHHPDPSVPENLEDLIAAVKATDADLGIAFDGDADRLGVVTKQGEVIFPDRLLMLFAQDVLTRQPGASIIFDVKCTGHLPKVIVENGGLPIIWKTGHSFMKAKIKETNAALAGEMSGHFFFNERWFGFDDGIYAAARLLEIIDQENRPAKEIFDELPNSISTPELKCHTEEGENYAFMDKFQKAAEFPDANLTTIDGIRADFADGWGLVRCSNTTPCLVLRFDADNEEALDKIKEEFRAQILAVDSSLKLPF
jgi:phosphomannomutase/phosphoglucomutase